jgi:cellulose 1,4-beta-cellobiosidase
MTVKVLALSTGLLGALFAFGVVPAAQNSAAAPAAHNSVVSAVQNSLVRAAQSVVPAVHNSAARAGQSVAPAAQSSSGGVSAALSDSGLKVQDRSHDNDNPDNTLYALYQIINTGTASVPLSSLTMRYWFTNETPADPLVFECDWAQVGCNNITSKFVTLPSSATKANMYLEIGFTAAAGSIAPGQGSGEIQTRVHHVNWSNFITTDSYSFISDPSFVYKDTQTVTLYLNGVLVWGVEPTQ